MSNGVLGYVPARQWTSAFVLGRDFLLPLVVVSAVLVLPSDFVVASIIFGGQAHFLMAYVYQYRAGKITFRYLALLLLLIVLWALYLFFDLPLSFLYLSAGTLFSVHFASDELTLHDERARGAALLVVTGFLAIYLGALFVSILDAPLMVAYTGAVLCAVCMFVRAVQTGPLLGNGERYLLLLSLILATCIVFTPTLLLTTPFIWFIAWLHFFNWMVGYGVRLSSHPARALRYWYEHTAVYALCGLLFILFLFFPFSFLQYGFSFSAYQFWSIAHIVLSSYLTLIKHS